MSSFKKLFFIKTLYIHIYFFSHDCKNSFPYLRFGSPVYSAVTQKCPAGGRSESSIVGWMLRGHVYDTLLAELPFTCVFKCREDNRCQSFNWVISLLTCEFNNRTKEARLEDFIPNSDRSYYRRDKSHCLQAFKR